MIIRSIKLSIAYFGIKILTENIGRLNSAAFW